ncbi:CDP-diacylglycerol--serine O-phosphatidyltransferase [Bacteroidia bacterium]|nr:CDP-diacylglycerol--serine O-phosphatidyltransferase [Bacteroidia bacterium]GHT62599.1 CDP-diacylglycerol--serine O-phosphatidyltransferase [Bacteroidia bacterium]
MKHIPNIITCLNLFAGCLSCIMILEYHTYFGAFVFIILAAIFDFLDGFSARLLKAFSPIGGQLDSLADVVSFGLAPGFMVFSFLNTLSPGTFFETNFLPYFAFLIPIFSALRLAKFNIDTRQKDSFLGLPVPANALFWASLIPAIIPFINGYETITCCIILALILLFCLLMVSELPLFSLKFKSYSWEKNQWSYLLIGIGILLILLFQFFGISLTIVCYIILSLIRTRLPVEK